MALEELLRIAQEVRSCRLCGLHTGRVKAVPGEGPHDARILFIGEGPGYHEDRQGRPFVGQSGQYLDELLGLAGLQRNEVFITNVVKCRPPGNRDPLPDEIRTCSENYLFHQIAAIDPMMIVTLGRYSMSLFLPGARIMSVHGQPRKINGRLVVPMIHPAAALHQANNRPLIEADFRRLPEILARAEQEAAATQIRPADDEPPLEQLSLF